MNSKEHEMSILSQRTASKYKGRMAAIYETKRMKQIRWHEENAIVTSMLESHKPRSVLDVPVGTGRFLQLYQTLNIKKCVGLDSSESMIELAKAKKSPYPLKVADARQLTQADKSFDTVVCVRFLDLIEEAAMQQVMKELCRVAQHCIILTIRLGDTYVLKVNTATHDTKKFHSLVAKCGWETAEQRLIFTKGWTVLRLQRKSSC
jgi:ubiquinone/menaquinone biosynthesis C-methylase UbiE